MGPKTTTCMSSWGNSGQKAQRPKNPAATPEEPGEQQAVGSKSKVLSIHPALSTTEGLGRPPKSSLPPDLGTLPHQHPIQGTS